MHNVNVVYRDVNIVTYVFMRMCLMLVQLMCALKTHWLLVCTWNKCMRLYVVQNTADSHIHVFDHTRVCT